MTNYERIRADKAFCAWLIADYAGCTIEAATEWLDAEQKTLTCEQEHKEDL